VSPGADTEKPRLGVVVDGTALSEEEARTLWQAFSAYMEEHRGDLGGFAKSQGFVSAHPRSEGGRAVLVLSKTAPQEEYGAVAKPVDAGGAKGRRRR
jgi:hypothetical protein